MKILISDIIIQERIRDDAGDLSELVDSIRKVGLIHPIIINEKNVLMSGYRRLHACKELGWEEIEAKVVATEGDALYKLDWEYHENVGRRSLSGVDEMHYEEMREHILNPPKPNFWQRIVNFFKKLFGRK